LQSSFYRFYPAAARGSYCGSARSYFADEGRHRPAAQRLIEDFPRLDIWCGQHRIGSFSREELVRLPAAATNADGPADQPKHAPAAASGADLSPHRNAV
jgi:hypothetical protein